MKKLLIIITLSILALDAFAQREVSGYVAVENDEPLTAIALETLDVTRNPIVARSSGLTALAPSRTQIIGLSYDIANSLFGVSFSYEAIDNWSHFPRFRYIVSAQSNFRRDYGFAVSVGHATPMRLEMRYIDGISLNYTRKNLSENRDFNFQKMSIRGYVYSIFRYSSWNSSGLRDLMLSVEPAIQSLNDRTNLGLALGLRYYWYRDISIGLDAGYFNDYWTFSARITGSFARSLGNNSNFFYWQLSYSRIDSFNFFNVGLSYRIFGRWN